MMNAWRLSATARFGIYRFRRNRRDQQISSTSRSFLRLVLTYSGRLFITAFSRASMISIFQWSRLIRVANSSGALFFCVMPGFDLGSLWPEHLGVNCTESVKRLDIEQSGDR